MNERDCVKIDYFIHEGEMVRAERHIKRLWIAVLILIIMLFAANAMWLYAWTQYDYASYEADVDADTGDYGNAVLTGDILNGTNINQNKRENPD